MGGLNVKRGGASWVAVIAVMAAAFLFSGCMADLGILTDLADRVARENFDYGIKTVATGANYAASLAVNGDNLYLLYYNSALQKLRITKSADKGKTWNTPFTVDNTTGYYGTSNNLVVDGSNIYIVYQRPDKVYFIQLTDTGASFTPSNSQEITPHPLYPNGYENSIVCDSTNVYIVYSSGGTPVFTYVAKGISMDFPTPVCFDSTLTTPGSGDANRDRTSTYIDSDGDINICYFDDVANRLKLASFSPGAALPVSVPSINIGTLGSPVYVTGAAYPSIGSVYGSQRFISYYDTAAKTLNCFEHFSFTYPPLMIGYVNKSQIVDNGSADVGRWSKMLYIGSDAYIAYYDYTNKQAKFAKGVKIPNNPPAVPPEYVFTDTVIETVGGTNFDCSLASDGTTLYIAYYDSANGGALKLAKSADGGITW